MPQTEKDKPRDDTPFFNMSMALLMAFSPIIIIVCVMVVQWLL